MASSAPMWRSGWCSFASRLNAVSTWSRARFTLDAEHCEQVLHDRVRPRGNLLVAERVGSRGTRRRSSSRREGPRPECPWMRCFAVARLVRRRSAQSRYCAARSSVRGGSSRSIVTSSSARGGTVGPSSCLFPCPLPCTSLAPADRPSEGGRSDGSRCRNGKGHVSAGPLFAAILCSRGTETS